MYAAGIQLHLIEEPFDTPAPEINTKENHIAFKVEDLDAAEAVLREYGLVYHGNRFRRGDGQISSAIRTAGSSRSDCIRP